jgi:hypothetical protein
VSPRLRIAASVSLISLGLVSEARAAPPEPIPEPRPHTVAGRNIELGPDFGVALRPADDRGPVKYSAAFVWGVHARVELAPWLAIRPWVRHAAHPVSIATGGLAMPGDLDLARTSFTQSALSLWILGMQLEPTLVVTPRLRLWSGFGAYWARVEAEAPKASLDTCVPGRDCTIQTAKRSGVLLDLMSSLGVTFDVVPRWLAATATVEYGFETQHSGGVFEPVQAFEGGQMHHLSGLPGMRASMTALLGLGVIL